MRAMLNTRQRRLRLLGCVLGGLLPPLVGACDPYGCRSEYRSATYFGILGQAVPPISPPTGGDSGRVFLSLNEWRGSGAQQSIDASINVRGFASDVSALHIREGTPASPGRLLWDSSHGYLVGDSIWNTGTNRFEGPGPWDDLWTMLESGHGYFEVVAPGGDSIAAGLRLLTSTPFAPSCT